MPDWQVIQADCVEAMAGMPEASVDAIVCDPPYHLTFMGRTWDHAPTPVESQAMHLKWAREALRVLKPGGHLLAFGGTRTYHRLACAVEDAGFEIRDCVSWMYGSGFPKSLNLNGDWQGWGTALKPAHEPIVVARKPLSGTVAGNVLEHGTGALNVDGCRVGTTKDVPGSPSKPIGNGEAGYGGFTTSVEDWSRGGMDPTVGRWPANVVLSHHESCVPVGTRRVKVKTNGGAHQASGAFPIENAEPVGYADADGLETVEAWECHPTCPVRMLDEQTGELRSDWARPSSPGLTGSVYGKGDGKGYPGGYADDQPSGASRFFYVAKSSAAERSAGLGGAAEGAYRNTHPT